MMRPAILLLITATCLAVGGCAPSGETRPAPPGAITADGVCTGARMLERNLGQGSRFEGATQIYLRPDGSSCRYGG